ncbi:hypothetical protein O181_088633 [Austropuccinia psidii MF-1]|uniref:Uncharacterized protein n=1 Tax=Austropuccinia psidii MF-1 TaxID=1389203 RepID=A0A9Q3IRU4_9BASI|nr:hypothetical protein [Austropuccinia psidii MF-1]
MFNGINYVQRTNEEVFNVEAINTHEEVHISPTNQQTNFSFQSTPLIMSTETAHELQLVKYVEQSQGISMNAIEEGENNSTISALEPIPLISKKIPKGIFLFHAKEFKAILNMHLVIARDQWKVEISSINIFYRKCKANLHEDDYGMFF